MRPFGLPVLEIGNQNRNANNSQYRHGDFGAFLATLGPSAPVRSLAALRRWNDVHAKEGTLRYGQALLDASDAMDVERDHTRYEADRAKDLALTRTHGIDAAMDAHRLDALLFAGSGNSDLAARAGYPSAFEQAAKACVPPVP